MTTSTDLPPTTRVTILKHLASGKGLDVVATIVHLTREQVLDVASHHGYPDRGKLAWAVDVLVKKIEEEGANLPDRTAEVHRDERRVTLAEQHARPAAPAIPTVSAEHSLIDQGKQHESKRIRAAANKVLDDLDRLRTLLRDDEKKHAARRKAEQEKREARRKAEEAKTAARAEIERLERQLAEAKAKLRGPKATTTRKAAAAKPAREQGPLGFPCRNEGCDKAYETPQGRSLHERQHCEHRAQAAS